MLIAIQKAPKFTLKKQGLGASVHEWALAQAVVLTAVRVAEREHAARITSVNVVLGELQQVDREVFETALGELARGTLAEGAEFRIEVEEARFRCRNCGYEWSLNQVRSQLQPAELEAIHFIPDLASSFFTCPQCKSPDFDIVAGRGVWVRSIEVEQ